MHAFQGEERLGREGKGLSYMLSYRNSTTYVSRESLAEAWGGEGLSSMLRELNYKVKLLLITHGFLLRGGLVVCLVLEFQYY